MLYIAAVAFGLAILLLLIDKIVASNEMNLAWAVRILVFIALMLVLYNTYKKHYAPPAPVKAEAATTR